MFIALEGVDGTGKTTIAKYMAYVLQTIGKNVILTREPNKEFREWILQSLDKFDNKAITLMFYACRVNHAQKLLIPTLSNKNNIVICDRFVGSTFAYNYARNPKDDLIWEIPTMSHFLSGVCPDITIVLTSNTDLIIKRLNERGEKANVDFIQSLDKAYKLYKNIAKEKVIYVDSNLSVKDVTANILNLLNFKYDQEILMNMNGNNLPDFVDF